MLDLLGEPPRLNVLVDECREDESALASSMLLALDLVTEDALSLAGLDPSEWADSLAATSDLACRVKTG